MRRLLVVSCIAACNAWGLTFSAAGRPNADGGAPTARAGSGSFQVTFDPALQRERYSGRVYVVLTRGESGEPRRQMNDWYGSSQVLAVDASGISPDEGVEIGAGAASWPRPFAEIAPGQYRAQAVARRNPDSPRPGEGPGDLYSDAVPVSIASDGAPFRAALKLTHAVSERQFRETDRIKLVSIVSPSLSEFYGREVKVNAGVVLPQGWKDDESVHYPTVYFIGGFGGSHHEAHQISRFFSPPPGSPDVLIVVPDPSCHYGHSVFADSANNGPRAKALVDELIPEVERRFHGAGSGEHRFVTGISSGGWSSLWLQITYPDTFSGTWSHCPDPVDFRDFQRIDLYAPGSNMYRDAAGARRPLARRGDQVALWYEDFVRQEEVLGDGGQIRSFEAVFSPRAGDGRPLAVFDRATGAVITDTARAWEPYDIRLVLERNWKKLGPALAGKIHVYAGGMDTYYLDGAAARLKESLKALGSDATVEIVPGMPHTIIPQGVQDMWSDIARKCP